MIVDARILEGTAQDVDRDVSTIRLFIQAVHLAEIAEGLHQDPIYQVPSRIYVQLALLLGHAYLLVGEDLEFALGINLLLNPLVVTQSGLPIGHCALPVLHGESHVLSCEIPDEDVPASGVPKEHASVQVTIRRTLTTFS
jgi:hypothetical protein